MKIYDTLTRSKEELVPLVPGEIKMYSCGVTVYDFSHVGHARMLMVFDVITRYLRFSGYRVTFGGSLVGAFYAFAIGYGIGWMIGVVYNRLIET